MSVLIKHMAMPKGCIYANDKDQTEYCPLLNHDDVPFCQYIEDEPEAAIGIDERPVYCPLYDVPKPCKDTVSRQDAIDGVKMLHDVAWKNWHEPTLSANVVLDMIRELPSAQPDLDSAYAEGYTAAESKYRKMWDEMQAIQPERKTGKWIKKPEFCGDDVSGFIDNHFSCSECKKEAEINSWGIYILSDFCPHCGARLVQEGEKP